MLSAISRIAIGAAFGAAINLALNPALMALLDTTTPYSLQIAFWIFVLLAAFIGVLIPTARKALGWGFAGLAVANFALPLSVWLLSTKFAAQLADGSAAGGATVSGTMVLLGVVLGSVCLALAVLLLRRHRAPGDLGVAPSGMSASKRGVRRMLVVVGAIVLAGLAFWGFRELARGVLIGPVAVADHDFDGKPGFRVECEYRYLDGVHGWGNLMFYPTAEEALAAHGPCELFGINYENMPREVG